MKSIKNFPLFFITLFMAVFISHSAFAAKTLTVGDASVNNTGDASSREFVLDIKAENFEDVNGLVFTLTFDDSVFEYVGLVQSDKPIDNKDYSETDENGDPIYTQPDATTIGGTIYYQANASNPGRVLIAAAGANYFASSAAEYIPFKVKLRVKQYQGNGVYPIRLQQTIIGPETAANAGYTENVALKVAAGLAPDAEPETAQSFNVALTSGTVTVSGGYTIEGTVNHGSDPADGVEVKLFKKSDTGYHFAGETVVSSGEYSFANQTAGTYQIRGHSLKPGFQRNAVSSDFEADTPDNYPDIVLAAYQSLVGDVTLNNSNIPGLKVKVVKKSDSSLVGYFNVDENGHFVTTALPGSSGDYDIYAVYGGVESSTKMTYGEEFNYELTLADLEISIACMSEKQYMVHVIQSDGKLEKTKSGTASKNPETVTISNLISGKDYRVSVVGEGIPVTFFDNDADPEQTPVFSETDLITLPHAAVVFDFCSEVSNTISGSVTKDSSGQAVDVYAISTDFTNVYTTTSDDSDGSYSLDVTPGEYMVYGLDDGVSFYYKTAEESTQKFSEKTIVDASSDGKDLINIILDVNEAEAYFYGRVTEKRSDGTPVANALIIAESSEWVVVSETDEQGAYRLEGFAADETATIFLPVFPGSEKTAAASNEGTEVDFIVNQGYTITGVVQVGEDDQDTVSGATVYLKDSNGKIEGLPVKSYSSGNFTLIDVAAGIYTVNAVHPQYKKYSDEIKADEDKSIVIKMTAGASINGNITDGTNPLEGVSVIILGNQKSYITTTDGNGTYEVKGLEHGQDYGVFTKKQGYVPQHASSVTADTAGETQNFTMPAVVTTYTVGGTITDDGSNVKDGSQVILYSIEVNEFMRTTTSSGKYSFTDVLGADDYNLLIRRAGKPPVKESVGKINADNSSLDVNIEPANIEVTIDLSDTQTGKTVLVYLVNKSQDVLKKVEATDAGSGNYTYTFLVRSGQKYKIAAFCEGYGVKWYNDRDGFSTADDVTAGGTANINLTVQ